MNIVEWAKELRWSNPQKYDDLKMWASSYRLATDEYKEEIKKIIEKNIPLDEEFYKMVDYLEWLDDEANRLYADCCSRGYFNF